MSKAQVCDNCGTTLVLDHNGEDENCEIVAWVRVSALDGKAAQDACTRSCAVALLADGTALADLLDDRLAGVAQVVNALREARDGDEAEDDEQADG